MAADPRPPHILRGILGRAAAGPALGAPCGDRIGAAPGAARRPTGSGGTGTGIRARGFGPRSRRWLLWEPGSAAPSSAGRVGVPGPEDRGGIGAGIGTGTAAPPGPPLPLRLRPVRGCRSPEPPEGREHLRSLARQGRSCRARPVARSVTNARPGTGTGAPDSAGTDAAQGLPVAPRPGAAPHRRAGMLQPGQTAPTAQRDPRERLASPGNGGTAVCRGALTAIPVSDLPELPHSCQVLNAKPQPRRCLKIRGSSAMMSGDFQGASWRCRSDGKLSQVGPTGGVLQAGMCIPFLREKDMQRPLLRL
ncbi:uncharacterized protein [Taeniopygia guttata]|uniref:uncharacterized protein n=1 Tax=Taeniopygia guttata TaxID=59729 RepID=UPI003BB8DDF8